jgi:hypothetical protein
MGNLQEAVSFNEVWQKYVRSEDNIIDTRCLYQVAQVSFASGAMFINEMQTVIRHNREYVPAYETLRHMMHIKGFALATDDEARDLVDLFNSQDGDLLSIWDKVSTEAKQVLIKAIINYPYTND